MMRSPGESDGSVRVQPPPGLLRNRGFVLLWAAYGISAMGDHISEMALLKTQDALNSPRLTQLEALITFMFMLPFFVLGPFNGLLADRLPRRGLMIFADLVRAAIMLNFAVLISWFSGLGEVWAFTPLLIVGVFAAVFSPARSALLPTLIREDRLIRANALTGGLGVIATMAAVMIGGYLAHHYAPSVSFHVDAATFVASAVLLMLLRVPAEERQRHHAGVGWSALREATRYVFEHRRVVQLILVAVVVWTCGALVRSTIPTLVRDVFDRPDYREMAGFQARLGLGMLIGAATLTLLGDALRSEIAITWSLAGIGVAIGLLTLSVFAPVSADLAYHLGGLAIILSGVFATGVMASYQALMQRIVPNRLRGRVFGLTDLATMAGLLLATGLLGIPRWPNIDRWVGWILLVVAATVCVAAVWSLFVRLSEAPGPFRETFWWNVNEFYCKFWFRMRRIGPCTVPVSGPVIVVCRHTSSIDPLLLIAASRRRTLGFLIAREYYDLPLVGRLIRLVKCVPVKRDGHDAAGTKAALRHLRAGMPLGIFIEGRIPEPDQHLEPKDGAAMLALRTGAAVVPATITGTRYDPGVLRSFFRRQRAYVRFGKPLELSEFGRARPTRETYRQVTKSIVDTLDAMREPAPDGP
ncbi:MAG TPA: MFS transporter [Phycisphaerae bacterium]|nr:MFS transporter [Phycisphaerae bacterium]